MQSGKRIAWACWVVASTIACTKDAAPSSPAPAAASSSALRYVGRESCARCHAREVELWTGSHHDRALEVADASTVHGRFDGATFEHFGVTSTFTQQGGRFRARTDGPDGEMTGYDIAYTIGVEPLEQYLIAFPRGRYQALNVCWDSRPVEQGGQRWFHLYPDEPIPHDDALHWTGPYQNWNFMCAECHSTNLRRNYREESDTYETTWSEIDVSCEACHGPASKHVEWAEEKERGAACASEDASGFPVSLGNPDHATWDFTPGTPTARRSHTRVVDASLDACARCHSRHSPIADDYAPGKKFLDHYQPALLTQELYYGDGQILEEVYEYGSFLQSKMHANGVTCTDCHEAHSSKLRESGNAMCAKCHQPETFDAPSHHHHEQGKAGSRCVECHMPTRNFMVVHARHDHSLRVPRPDLTIELGSPNACNGCHSGKSPQWAMEAAQGWWGGALRSRPHYGQALHAGRMRAPDAEQLLFELLRDPEQPAIVRASAASHAGDLGVADVIALLEPALEDRDPLVRAAAASALHWAEPTERVQAAAALLSDPVRLVRIEAAHALVTVPRSAFSPDQLAAFERGLDEYRHAQTVNADRAEARLNLGVLALDLHDAATAQREFSKAIQLSPRLPAGYANLADLYRMLGREQEAEAVCRLGLEADPRSADLRHALGLALIRQQRHGEALVELGLAVQHAPDQVRYRYVHAIALHSAGRRQEALEELRLAHAQEPADLDLLDALIAFHRELGQPAEALRYVEQYLALSPSDENMKLLAERLRSSR